MEGRVSAFLCMGLFLAALIHAATAAVIPGFQECILNNRRYSIGEMFHPVVEVNGTEFEAVCFECECQPSAIAQCERVICPPAVCPDPIRIDGTCCSVCLEPPTLTPTESCLYHGIRINRGAIFRPTSLVEDYQSQEENLDVRNECVECKCEYNSTVEETNIECYDVSNNCPALTCNETEAEYVEGQCCKQCPVVPQTPVTGSGCYDFEGRFILEGDWWHPILPDYGEVTCVNCTCQDSLPRCGRLPCPEVPLCGPDDPVEDVVICCPRCNPSVPRIPTLPPTTLNGSNSTNSTTPIPSSIDFTPDITPCESPYVYKIYRNIYHDALALLNLETSRVEVYNWTTMVGPEGPTVERGYRELTEQEFVSESEGAFLFVGWTIDRRVRGLMNKPSKRQRIEACIEDCARMVANMLRPVYTLSETLVCGGI